MKHIFPFIVIIVFIAAIAIVIISSFNYRLKKRIIESGPIDDNSLKFLGRLSGIESEALKWGLILLFGGIGMVMMEFIPYSFDSPLPYGIETIFLAIGFLLYYFIIRKKQQSTD
jgi:hypothetical protein